MLTKGGQASRSTMFLREATEVFDSFSIMR
jgi:hypothetical protein